MLALGDKISLSLSYDVCLLKNNLSFLCMVFMTSLNELRAKARKTLGGERGGI